MEIPAPVKLCRVIKNYFKIDLPCGLLLASESLVTGFNTVINSIGPCAGGCSIALIKQSQQAVGFLLPLFFPELESSSSLASLLVQQVALVNCAFFF